MNISPVDLLSGSVNITHKTHKLLLKLRIKFNVERECEHVKVGKSQPFLFLYDNTLCDECSISHSCMCRYCVNVSST
jgi:hypothetical protein